LTAFAALLRSGAMPASWERVVLGRTGLSVCPIGLGASYGMSERDIERACERGVNYLYWGSRRRTGFGRAIRSIARRDRGGLVTVVQSYSRSALGMRASLELALRRLDIEYTDLLLLGWWNQLPPRRIVDAALALCAEGKARHIAVSCHNRPMFEQFIADEAYGAIMVRYNAAHRGAEREVFPHLGSGAPGGGPGVVAYTATRWGALLDPKLTPPHEATPRASDCYRFALSNPAVHVCLSGPRNGAELDEALAALDRGPMDDDELAWMRRIGAAVHAAPTTRAWSRPAHLLDTIAGRVLPGRV
jgi:aryl-alcohol dehydrogenase-like predicted oxidoreductase